MGRKKKSAIEKSLSTKKSPKLEGQDTYIVIGIVLLILSLLSFLGFFIHVNALKFLYTLLGDGIIIFAIFSFLLSLRFLGTKIKFNTVSSIIGLLVFIIATLSFINLMYSQPASLLLSSHGKIGGAVGYLFSQYLRSELSRIGAIIILIPIIIISLMMSISFSFIESIRKIKGFINFLIEKLFELQEQSSTKGEIQKDDNNIQNIEFEVTGKNKFTGVDNGES